MRWLETNQRTAYPLLLCQKTSHNTITLHGHSYRLFTTPTRCSKGPPLLITGETLRATSPCYLSVLPAAVMPKNEQPGRG